MTDSGIRCRKTELKLWTAGLVFSLMLTSACGEADNPAERAADASRETNRSETEDTRAAPLPISPINVAGIVNDSPATFSEPGPCPFLSDETAIGAISTPYEITRNRVANDACVWNYNIGFEIRVRIDPVSDTTPRAQRNYNMDVPPVIEPQNGPGTGAVLFLDPTWDDVAPRPYAFAFTLGEREIMIRTVGTKTTLAQLRQVADEIAERLPTATPIEPQQRQQVPAFNACDTWSRSEVLGVFQLDDSTPGDGRASASHTCLYEFFPDTGGSVKVHLGYAKCDPSYADTWKNDGYSQLSGDVPSAWVRQKEESWGTDINMYAMTPPVCVQLYSPQNRAPVSPSLQSKMETLLNNAAARVSEN